MENIPEFEYDLGKSVANLRKHGIDFEAAQELWKDKRAICGPSDFHHGEDRALFVGKIGAKHWTAIYTLRNERIRIISVRRSRSIEAAAYDR